MAAAAPHSFPDYVPAPVLTELATRLSADVQGVPGLRIVGGIPPEYAHILSVPALQYLVQVYEDTLAYPNGLDGLMAHRKVKRACINERARHVAARGGELQNVELPDGTLSLGYRPDLASIRNDPSWKVIDVPTQFQTFHDTITGPPTAPIVANALKSGVSFFMVDFEDSSTVAFENVMDGIVCVTQANRRELDYRAPNGKRYTVLREDADKLGEMIVRFEGLHLPNPHFIYKGVPLPAHVVTVALYTFHNWEPLARLNKLPSFYVPKLESYEEACYVANLFRSCRDLLPDPVAKEQMSHLSCFVIIENVFSVYQKEEILYALRDYIVGLNCGWHDYMASIGAVHQELPEFTMPPKSNLRIVVEHLEAYQAGIADVCRRRGALPIGGMNAMVPPKPAKTDEQRELDGDVENKIRESFAGDFWAQVNRGLDGVWLAHKNLAPVAKSLISEMNRKGRGEVKLTAPITHDKMLVTHLKIPVYSYAEFERNIADALQYLASYLTGTGSVGLTARFKDGGRVRLMEDAATLERSRRELWSIARFGKKIQKEDGTMLTANADLVRATLAKVMDDIQHEGDDADVPFNIVTKNAYDAAMWMVEELTTAEEPVDYFTALATKFLIKPFRNDPGFLDRIEKSDEYPFLHFDNVIPYGRVVSVTNEKFAPASSLLRGDFPQFQPHLFGPEGQIYDGWETSRHNLTPPDRCVIELPTPVCVYGVNIDTAHFTGNYAPGASVDGKVTRQVDNRTIEKWIPLTENVVLAGNSRNYAFSTTHEPVTAVRLNMCPDGGIARLQVFGLPALGAPVNDEAMVGGAGQEEDVRDEYIRSIPFLPGFPPGYRRVVDPNPHNEPAEFDTVVTNFPFDDLVELACGGHVVVSSNHHYSDARNLLKPRRGVNMGDGWETSRKREPEIENVFTAEKPPHLYEWVVIQLREPGVVKKVVIDTLHFKNNHPVAVSVSAASRRGLTQRNYDLAAWKGLVKPSRVGPNAEHVFECKFKSPVSHLLVKIYPCGGLSRVRVWGEPNAPSSL